MALATQRGSEGYLEGNLSDTSWLTSGATQRNVLDIDQTDDKGRVSQKEKDLVGEGDRQTEPARNQTSGFSSDSKQGLHVRGGTNVGVR